MVAAHAVTSERDPDDASGRRGEPATEAASVDAIRIARDDGWLTRQALTAQRTGWRSRVLISSDGRCSVTGVR
jgi:hypothetical protein